MRKVVVVSAVRTAIGKHLGQWKSTPTEVMTSEVIKEAIKRAGVDPALIEDVCMGNIHGPHGNIARVSSLMAGLPIESGAVTIDRQCGSGTQAIVTAAMSIAYGAGDVYIACGAEHMTLNPYQMSKTSELSWAPPKFLGSYLAPVDVSTLSMPETADKLAKMKGFTREQLDEFALISHQRAAEAIKNGTFKEEILPFEVKISKKETAIVDTDEPVRYDASLESMAKLKPLYPNGVTTAGNSCPRADGAGAMVLMSEEKALELGIKPLAYVKNFAVSGCHPDIMGYGPVPAVTKLLERTGLKIEDIGVVELNEAFAGQALPCINDLKMDISQVNPNGGAIALGHPLGGTGVILSTKLLYEMKRKSHKYGIVTMCIGGGQGMATLFERYEG
ncbi:MAG: thiolase family protein [Sedimentibacter sp.]|uniref:thiolase family protein n=1 Tax=Sedimentibacter sp. TaxID=1960295 RepID=UPI003159762E